ncbi:hypothetical protein [Comamonas sp.]|uniref:hypothetical protein n=1 Tax=Comamonas sp. TaxID=34028 RepID=UPI003A90C725
MYTRRTALSAALLLPGMGMAQRMLPMPPVKVSGMVWQPDNATSRPQGEWQRLGIQTLLIQWLATDDGSGKLWRTPSLERLPAQPWAQSIIAGLVGDYDEPRARRRVELLAQASARLAKEALPFEPVGWYFPVESDPNWKEVNRLAESLQNLPRPLWVSAYDNSNLGPKAFARWVKRWLPQDVGLFFQDGVGLHTRSAATAARYALALADTVGWQRLKVIAEAFRPDGAGHFRSATALELRAQLSFYAGWPVLVFDGPHYLTPALVEALAQSKP